MRHNSNEEPGQDDPYITRETVSSAFAKLTCLCDEGPYLYRDSSDALFACLQYIAVFTNTSLRQDPVMVALFVWFMKTRIERIVCKILLESFLDSCIIEKWAEDIDDEALQRFTHLTISLLLLEAEVRAGRKHEIGQPQLATTQNLSQNLPPLVFPTNLLIKILEKLYVIASQHVHSCIKYEKCIEVILLVHTQKPEVLRYLCNMIMNPSTLRRDIVVIHATDYACSWFQKLLKDPILTGQCPLVELLSSIRQDLVVTLEAPDNKSLALLILWINKLILCLNYFGDVYPSFLEYEDLQRVPSSIANKREPIQSLKLGTYQNSVRRNAFLPRSKAPPNSKDRNHQLMITIKENPKAKIMESDYSSENPELEEIISNPWEYTRSKNDPSNKPNQSVKEYSIIEQSVDSHENTSDQTGPKSKQSNDDLSETSSQNSLFAKPIQSLSNCELKDDSAAILDYQNHHRNFLHRVSEILNNSKMKALFKRRK